MPVSEPGCNERHTLLDLHRLLAASNGLELRGLGALGVLLQALRQSVDTSILHWAVNGLSLDSTESACGLGTKTLGHCMICMSLEGGKGEREKG